MKHSRHIALVLLGSVSVMALVGCNEDETKKQQAIYESVQQCEDSGRKDCEAVYSKALGNHVATGPRYSSQESCIERGHERCMNVGTGSTDIWLPAMLGFMVGRALDSSRPVYMERYHNPTTDREREDRRVVAGGTVGGRAPSDIGSYHGGGTVYSSGSLGSGMSSGASRAGTSSTPSQPAGRAAATTSTAARGGFGSSGASAAAGS